MKQKQNLRFCIKVQNNKDLIPFKLLLILFFCLWNQNSNKKQECIPVGCVPLARYRMEGLSLTETPWTETPSPGQWPPPLNRITNMCKKHYLPSTSFAGGNKRLGGLNFDLFLFTNIKDIKLHLGSVHTELLALALAMCWILDTFQMKQTQMYVCTLKNLF